MSKRMQGNPNVQSMSWHCIEHAYWGHNPKSGIVSCDLLRCVPVQEAAPPQRNYYETFDGRRQCLVVTHPTGCKCFESSAVPSPAAPDAPSAVQEPKWNRQESCAECDGDGCLKCEPPTAEPASVGAQASPMKWNYDDEAGAGYLYFFPEDEDKPGICFETRELYPGINLDLKADGTPFGIEVFGVFKESRGGDAKSRLKDQQTQICPSAQNADTTMDHSQPASNAAEPTPISSEAGVTSANADSGASRPERKESIPAIGNSPQPPSSEAEKGSAQEVVDDMCQLCMKDYKDCTCEEQRGRNKLAAPTPVEIARKGMKCDECVLELDLKIALQNAAMWKGNHDCQVAFKRDVSNKLSDAHKIIATLTKERDWLNEQLESERRADIEINEIVGKLDADVDRLRKERDEARQSWKCFHCEFTTSDPIQAQAHFGDRDDASEFTPLCKWWATMDDTERKHTFQEMNREIAYNQAEAYKAEKRAETAEAELTRLKGALAELDKLIRLVIVCPTCEGTGEMEMECASCALGGTLGECTCGPEECAQCEGRKWDTWSEEAQKVIAEYLATTPPQQSREAEQRFADAQSGNVKTPLNHDASNRADGCCQYCGLHRSKWPSLVCTVGEPKITKEEL